MSLICSGDWVQKAVVGNFPSLQGDVRTCQFLLSSGRKVHWEDFFKLLSESVHSGATKAAQITEGKSLGGDIFIRLMQLGKSQKESKGPLVSENLLNVLTMYAAA